MKRFLLTLAVAALAQVSARADNAPLRGYYWFDDGQPTQQLDGMSGQLSVDVSELNLGLHSLNVMAVDSGGRTSPILSQWFLKAGYLNGGGECLVRTEVDGKELQVARMTVQPDGRLPIDLDMSGVSNGVHSLGVQIFSPDGKVSPILSQWFLKAAYLNGGSECLVRTEVDGKELSVSRVTVQSDGRLPMDLDMSDLPMGFHSLGVQIFSPDGKVSPMMNSMFVRVPSASEMSELKFYYMIDGKLAGAPISVGAGGVCNLTPDVSDLSTGVHSFSGYLASSSGLATEWVSKLFIKIPNGGYGVRSYEYWINADESTRKSVKFDRTVNPLELVTLLDVPVQPFSSARYGFALENGAPVAYGRNEFAVRFFDADGRIISNSAQFNDGRVRKPIEKLQEIAPGRTKVGAQAANDIDWFTFSAEQGDSIGIKLVNAGMWELYDPKGNPVGAEQGIRSTENHAATLTENGTYYLAVHDIIGSRSSAVDFVHIPRFALLGFTPDRSSNSDLLIMKFDGNGFDSLESIELRGDNGTVRPATKIEKYNNFVSLAMFDFDLKPLVCGNYTPVMIFKDPDTGKSVEATLAKKTLVVEPPKPGHIYVNLVQESVTSPPYGTKINIHNNSNEGKWDVPIYIAVGQNKGSNASDNANVQFNNFAIYAENELPEGIPFVSHTDNLLGTGQSGSYIPAVIPYIAPYQSITLETGYEMRGGSNMPTYVWAGEPLSEGFKRMSSPGYDCTKIFNNSTGSNTLAEDILELGFYAWTNHYGLDLGFEPAVSMGTIGDGSTSDQIRAFMAEHGSNMGLLCEGLEKGLRVAIGGSSLLALGWYGVHMAWIEANLAARGLSPMNPEYAVEWEKIEKDMDGMRHAYDLMMEALELNDPSTACGFVTQLLQRRLKNGWYVSTAPNPTPKCYAVQGYVSFDPNEMTGHRSPSGSNYIAADVETVTYTIEFENDPEFATAPASRIAVSNTVDGNGLDRATMRPLKLIISDKEVELPAEHHFVKTVDMRPNINAIAELDFNYDAESGKADWKLRSLDPMTLEPITDFDYGILPVNDDMDRGIGRVIFSVDVKPDVADGLEIPARASIVFDDNEPIETPLWVNTTDLTEPVGRIVALETSDNKTFNFAVDGTDAGSGIWSYDLLVRPAGNTEWTIVKTMIEQSEFSYTSETELIGADFAVLATDRAGNRQSVPATNSLRGDADGNGRVDANDVVVIRNHYTGKATAVNAVNADVSRDGRIDAQDATGARNLYLDEKTRNLKPKRK